MQVGHETTYASSGNNHFFTKSYHCQTYRKYIKDLCKAGLIEFINNIGRSDDDII